MAADTTKALRTVRSPGFKFLLMSFSRSASPCHCF